MKTFKEHRILMEKATAAQQSANAKRGDNWEAELVYVHTEGAVDKIKKRYPMTNKRKEIAARLLQGMKDKGMVFKNTTGRCLGEKPYTISPLYNRFGKTRSQLAKTDIVLAGNKISLKMDKGNGTTVNSGENAFDGLSAVFYASLDGPEPLKRSPKDFMKNSDFAKEFFKYAKTFDNAGEKFVNMSKIEGFKDFVDYERTKDRTPGGPDFTKRYPHSTEFKAFYDNISNSWVQHFRDFNKNVQISLQETLKTDPNFMYNIVFNEATGAVKFVDDEPKADWLVVGNKTTGKIIECGNFNKKSFTRKLSKKAKVNFKLGLSNHPDEIKVNKSGDYMAKIGGSGNTLVLKLDKIDEAIEYYMADQLSELNAEMLTEGQMWDKVKSVFNKVKEYLLKIWDAMVKWVGDSWERLFRLVNVEFKNLDIVLRV
ncbi:MAG TPA: hypothetical protein EYG21_07565 [Nitrospinaceae bacterium]|nr:hypothetical protein [Nitrospinaceae bacterium]